MKWIAFILITTGYGYYAERFPATYENQIECMVAAKARANWVINHVYAKRNMLGDIKRIRIECQEKGVIPAWWKEH